MSSASPLTGRLALCVAHYELPAKLHLTEIFDQVLVNEARIEFVLWLVDDDGAVPAGEQKVQEQSVPLPFGQRAAH